ncbi:phage major capsid protein [Rhodococcus sp. LW-XY12]|uniref:phage major capsid protein n=1 Tax=Rhodococcus sp. LW-XY12 TaxID=2856851 RepID=UPI001C5A233C|nr:phage major capsid protein [Rhodococcus sp. LW-XY12]QXU55204.1 phage major capsid protein [Rhodococcus sp. LW-XY12]
MTEEIRSAPITGLDEEKREISGIAVPWGEVTTRIGYPETFDEGSIPDGTEGTLHVNHGGQRSELPIGRFVGRSTPAGYRITAQVSRTPRGDEVLALVRDGVLKHFSVGFVPVEHEMRGDTVARTKVILRETSIVERPAYEGAVIESVRSAATEGDTDMPQQELDELREEIRAEYQNQITELERRITTKLDTPAGGGARTFKARSGGEFLKGLARGDKDILAEYRTAVEDFETRAYTGATLETDSLARPAWLNKILRLTDRKRPLTTLFRSEPLPADGMSYEYPYVSNEIGTVQEQVNEGDDLAFLKIQIGTDSATVRTVGGYTSLSRQVIERSSVAWLDAALRWLAIQYYEAFEAYVQAFFEGLPTDDLTARKNVNEIDLTSKPTTADGWIGAAFDAATEIEDNSKGLLADFIVVDRGTAKEMLTLKDSTGRPIFAVNGDGQNTWGDLGISGTNIVGSVANLPLVMVPRLTGPTFTVCSRDAITTMESAGAPVRLEDENIINLTKDFSLYGYQSIYSEERKGITKVTWA